MLEIEDLTVAFQTERGALHALEDFSLDVGENQFYGVVGESGAGKSTVARAVLGILPTSASTPTGRIVFRDRDLLSLSSKELREIRGKEVAMIFQEPNEALNPVLTIGQQLSRVAKRANRYSSKNEIRRSIIAALEQVNISNPEERMESYPVEFSGGMNQRVMIAMMLLCNPDLIIADEPTTKLDATISANILELLLDVATEQNMSVLLITHNLGIVAQFCDRVAILYAGRKVEDGRVDDVLTSPKHPYTKGLMECIPDPHSAGKLQSIPGRMPTPIDLPDQCRFVDRCPIARERCREATPPLIPVETPHGDQRTACYFPDEV